ncbi:MAG: helix-turn-helix transcriptional regulator [Verrucomicrobiales bacterium]|nr:helix-turn-helix transcriptional regulator [Verrucomicrobiales bacterium]
MVSSSTPNTPVPAGSSTDEAVSSHLCRRVRDLRKDRGWSLEQLAAASGVSRSMLSQIERNEANPTLAVTFRIAQAFGMTLAELLETPGAQSSIQTIRGNDKAHLFRSDPDCQIRTLSPLNLEKDVEFYEIRLGPGGALRSAPHFTGTREYLTVLKGRVQVESGGDKEELGAGDSASFRADVPHAIINSGRTEALAYLVDIYR